MRIAYIINGLYNSAGMERVFTVRANSLCKTLDITFITNAQGDKPNYFPLDKRIHRIDIGGEKSYREGLEQCLIDNKFDITVSTGGEEFYFLYKIKDGSKKVFEFHFSYDISMVWMGGIKNPVKRRLLIELQKFRRIYIASHYDKVVVLTKTDCVKWSRWLSKVTYIYNPLTIKPEKRSTVKDKVAIAVGRLNYEKGFDYLIEVWEKIYKVFPDWRLDIFGSGSLKEEIQDLIGQKGLSNAITLRGTTSEVVKEYQRHSVYVMTSRSEGFPLVLVEAGACGLPAVSFDCPSGPAEIIKHGENGFLVSTVGDVESMAKYLIKLMSDYSLRQQMGQRSIELSERFKIGKVSAQWIELYNEVVNS